MWLWLWPKSHGFRCLILKPKSKAAFSGWPRLGYRQAKTKKPKAIMNIHRLSQGQNFYCNSNEGCKKKLSAHPTFCGLCLNAAKHKTWTEAEGYNVGGPGSATRLVTPPRQRRFETNPNWAAAKSFFRRAEMSTLLNGYNVGLQNDLDFFQQFWERVGWVRPARQEQSSIMQTLLADMSSIGILSYNLETLWECAESRSDVEEFRLLLTDVDHLALMVDTDSLYAIHGSYHLRLPCEVLRDQPKQPGLGLSCYPQNPSVKAARHDGHSPEEINKILLPTDNMPLAINPLAHLLDSGLHQCLIPLGGREDLSDFSRLRQKIQLGSIYFTVPAKSQNRISTSFTRTLESLGNAS
ncbi:hypothetical protein B0H13DRAFT_1903886 [Mycena leptocephala]|nr:hypothetical protein B0H13DRAFT_1903886 [Mycena leptocephala]